MAGKRHSLEELKKFFKYTYETLRDLGFFQEAFGYDCVDAGFVPGVLGMNIHNAVLLNVGKSHLWSDVSTDFVGNIDCYDEEDVFDMIEFLFQQVSEPDQSTGFYHDYNDCGWHYNNFYSEGGRERYRQEINKFLIDYGPGYRLSESGEVEETGDPGLESLLDAQLPTNAPKNVQARVSLAIRKYREYNADIQDKRIAITELVSVLEYLRPKLKGTLNSKDERDLFEIANNFGIRHNRQNQKTDYDPNIWYRWMFYYYLATIHASLRLINRAESQETDQNTQI